MDNNTENILHIIEKEFQVSAVQAGAENSPFILRVNGEFRSADIEGSYNRLAAELEGLNLLAILKPDGQELELTIIPVVEPKKKVHPRVNLLMFVLTLFSVLFTGGLYAYQGPLDPADSRWILDVILSGWPFALGMLAILGAHEFGHYFAGKAHGANVTLPFFIPFPLSSFGTMGAIINMRSIPRNKKALFDLAFTGPVSGFIVSIIVLIIGLSLSETGAIPLRTDLDMPIQMEGNSLLYLFIKYIMFGKLLPHPAGLNGLSLLVFWGRYFFTGLPFPYGAEDVLLHPVAWAGWAGLFITGLNLIPAGQLDGGHILQAVFSPKLLRRILPYVVGGLAVMGFFWNGWWMWALLLFFIGRQAALPLDQVTQLDRKRKILGYVAIIIFLITFIPVPISIVGM